AVLPSGTMREVRYEDLVGDLEGQARQLLAYCGLEWDEACLSFHETKRPVETASVVQVRQPIHAGAVGRSRLYGARLAPLVETLEGEAFSPLLSAIATTKNVNEKELERQVDRALRLAKHLRQHGDVMIAEQLFSFAAAARPGHYDALLGLGTICAASNR